MAWKINEGHYGETELTGAVYWIAGDLGWGLEDGIMDWAALHFNPHLYILLIPHGLIPFTKQPP